MKPDFFRWSLIFGMPFGRDVGRFSMKKNALAFGAEVNKVT